MSAETAPAEPEVPEVLYKLTSRDGDLFTISSSAVVQSVTLSDMISCLNLEPSQMDPLPVNNVGSDTMRLILEWCEHHKHDAPPRNVENQQRRISIPEWDLNWLRTDNIDNEQLFHLICGANFLNIPVLLDYTCKTVANMAKGKSPEELREVFGILTDEEEERLARELARSNVEVAGTSM